MPAVVASALRRSTRSPTPTSISNGSLTAQATAFQLLKEELDRDDEWREVRSGVVGLHSLLVKMGYTLENAGEQSSHLALRHRLIMSVSLFSGRIFVPLIFPFSSQRCASC